MSAKHAQILWFGAPKATQASLMLSAMQEELATPASTEVEVKISTEPSPNIADVEPPMDSLPFVPDTAEDASTELSPEQE